MMRDHPGAWRRRRRRRRAIGLRWKPIFLPILSMLGSLMASALLGSQPWAAWVASRAPSIHRPPPGFQMLAQ
ncbi:uncharacterized protein LY79DRAFT_564905 [Colletotrichum navitas]|uniref:Uncharacterized protein n=1 Tax=Colletotrichum navitas TaxID=681940 RepID=A0AAD8PSD4_9PEZI|nr:uncharacterized protein LY79DRAFT_564905 [Colletotrichum navitas]KAK1579148.1 hypothetical protein LY79DRAFT_564905 [Colletotrichum navitas]